MKKIVLYLIFFFLVIIPISTNALPCSQKERCINNVCSNLLDDVKDIIGDVNNGKSEKISGIAAQVRTFLSKKDNPQTKRCEAYPWIQNMMNPLREIYVSPSGVNGWEIKDYSRNKNDTFVDLQPEVVSGKVVSPDGINRALHFNGKSDYIKTKPFELGNSFSYLAWIKWKRKSGVPSQQVPTILGSGSVNQFAVDQANGDRLLLQFYNGSANCVVRPASADLTAYENVYTHVAVTYQEPLVTMYINGQPSGTGNCVGKPLRGIIAIGQLGDGRQYFNGSIDEIKIYNRTLTNQEILDNYNGGQGQYGFLENGLQLGYHFDEAHDIEPGTIQLPINLRYASKIALPGDFFHILSGEHIIDILSLGRAGTKENPIVFKGVNNRDVKIKGGFDVEGDYVWLWDLDISNPIFNDGGTNLLGTGVNILAKGTHLINNIIHDSKVNGIGAWNQGEGQVIYGNIVLRNGQQEKEYPEYWNKSGLTYRPEAWHGHGIYVQNNYDDYGYKYIINNIFIDSRAYNFHAYGTCRTCSPIMTGYWVEDNIFANGPFLIGGYNRPPQDNIVRKNYFYQSSTAFGYARPAQTNFQDNYLGRSRLVLNWFWGNGETVYVKNQPSIISGNTFIPNSVIIFRTSAYLSTGKAEGIPKIEARDVFDNNVYSEPFTVDFFADNKQASMTDFGNWKTLTSNAGNAFDVNSELIPAPTEEKVKLIPNDYDDKKFNLVVYNWGLKQDIPLDLSPMIKTKSKIKIYDVENILGLPVFSGNYLKGMNLPLNNKEFSTFLIEVE